MFNNVNIKSHGTHHLRLDQTGLHLATQDQLAHLSGIRHLCEQQQMTGSVILILQDNGESQAASLLLVGLFPLSCFCFCLLTVANRVTGEGWAKQL